MRFFLYVFSALATFGAAAADTLTIESTPIVEWKAVYGQVESRDRVPARVRIGGTIVSLEVTEGDRVTAGQRIAMVQDDKLNFQLAAIDARLEALGAQLETALADLERGKQLIDRGVITKQRFDQLQTAFDVLDGEIRSLTSERHVVEQRVTEGEVTSPDDGVVLTVPIARGSVVTPGEAAAVIGGGGVYLRLSVPERHARDLAEGDIIELAAGANGDSRAGKLVKLYPQIEGGRVQADVEVDGLEDRFVGQRLPVRLPVAERMAILVPEQALHRVGGLDFVTVEAHGAEIDRAVVPGGKLTRDGKIWREILSGVFEGDVVVTADE